MADGFRPGDVINVDSLTIDACVVFEEKRTRLSFDIAESPLIRNVIVDGDLKVNDINMLKAYFIYIGWPWVEVISNPSVIRGYRSDIVFQLSVIPDPITEDGAHSGSELYDVIVRQGLNISKEEFDEIVTQIITREYSYGP